MILGYKRGQRVQEHQQSLVKIEGVLTKKDASFYYGKRIAYVYKGKRATKNKVTGKDTRYRVIWGRIMRAHGNSGTVRVKFTTNLPPHTISASCRVVCFCSVLSHGSLACVLGKRGSCNEDVL